jgi:hypothetical protein
VDSKQFDSLIKHFGTTRLNRGTALRGFVAGIATAVTGLGLTALDAGAKKKKKRSKKGKKKKGKGSSGTAKTLALPNPTPVPGNPTCPSTSGVSFKVDPPVSGCKAVTVDDCTCTLCWTISADGKKVSFGGNGSTCRVKTVIVKGADAGNVYTFDGTGVTSASDLVSPLKNGKLPAISHVNFCGITCCTPKTCTDLGKECGTWDDTCGGQVDCGECQECDNSYCDDTGQCQCTPETCASLTKQCGRWPNGCCDELECPPCEAFPNSYCDDDGQCQCAPDTCESLGKECNSWSDGCGATLDCGVCEACDNSYCSDNGHCKCEPNTCQEDQCGEQPDGCCGTLDCGPCCAHSCTIGRYRQGCYPPGYSASTPFPCANDQGLDTFGQALAASGGNVIWAQRAAALLNLAWFGCYAYDGDICTADIAALEAANSHDGDTGRTCPPVSACGNPV